MIHDAIGTAVHPLIKFVSKVTGRPSWRLAVPAAHIAPAFDVGHSVWEAIFGSRGAGLLLLAIAAIVAWWIIPQVTQAAEDAENAEHSTSGTVNRSIHADNLYVWQIIFPLTCCMNAGSFISAVLTSDIDSLGAALFSGLADLLYLYAVWGVWFIEPGGKSVFARAKDKIKSMVRLPDLVPVPA